MTHRIVSREEWTEARRQLLAKEKELTRLRDRLSEERRALPWVRVEKDYVFDTPSGRRTLAQLFEGRSQLVVYHFMYGPDAAPCKSCSFWADNFERIVVHLAQRDATMIAVSRAPLEKIEEHRRRMGWSFTWVSSGGSDFNYDYHVSFRPEELARGEIVYNYARQTNVGPEWPGISVFFKDRDGAVFHTYSCYARGLEMMNAAYQYLDLLPKGRDEAALPWPMAWVRYRDSYPA
jgi:predicted dithiol-disulfide oxidoreductase (DUF899 family)